MVNTLFKKHGSSTTLVVEDAVARVLQTNGTGIKKWETVALPYDAMSEGLVRNPESLGSALAQLFASAGLPPRDVVTCVSGAQVLHRSFTLPPVRREDLKAAVLYQAKREMPVPLEDLVFAWQVIESTEQGYHVFGVGVVRESVEGFMAALRHGGIKPSAIDVKPLALARLATQASAVIGNIEQDCIDIIYVQDQSPVMMRTVYFPDPSDQPEELAHRFAEEVQRSIRAYNDSYRSAPVEYHTPVLLTGGGADYYEMTKYLYGLIEYNIERLQPPMPVPQGFAPEPFAANLGLTLKGGR